MHLLAKVKALSKIVSVIGRYRCLIFSCINLQFHFSNILRNQVFFISVFLSVSFSFVLISFDIILLILPSFIFVKRISRGVGLFLKF